jgi:hypothetical protein
MIRQKNLLEAYALKRGWVQLAAGSSIEAGPLTLIDGAVVDLMSENPLLGSEDGLAAFREQLPDLRVFAGRGEWKCFRLGLQMWATYFVISRFLLRFMQNTAWKTLRDGCPRPR